MKKQKKEEENKQVVVDFAMVNSPGPKRKSEPVSLLGLSQVVNRQNADRQTDIKTDYQNGHRTVEGQTPKVRVGRQRKRR